MCMPACVSVACAWVCICVIAFWQAGRCCSRGGRSCREAVCLSGQHHDNSCSLTPAYGGHCHLHAVTHLQPARGSLRSPFPEPHRCDAASWGLNSGNWVVNILKCSSTWVYFTPVIRYFQCICYGCWAEDYCTYRSYYITVSCCSFCEAVSFQSKMKCLLRSYVMLLSPFVTRIVSSGNGKNEIDWQPRQLCSIVHL